MYGITGAIIDMAMKRVIDETNNGLSERDATAIYSSLARLYLYERRFDKALMLYMTLGDKGVFQIIEKYHLFDLVSIIIVAHRLHHKFFKSFVMISTSLQGK